MAEIRAQATTVRIPPPGTRITHEPHDTDPEPPERTWRCDLNTEHDPLTRCGAEFSSYKALAMHTPTTWVIPDQSGLYQLLSQLPVHVRQQALRHQSPYSCLHHWPLSQEPQRTQSHLARGKHGIAVQDLPRVEHGHQAAPATRSHPLTEPTTSHQYFPVKHVVICASHADRQRRGIERGIWMAARHHHRRWRQVISRTQQQEAAHRRSDEHGRSRTPKNLLEKARAGRGSNAARP